MASGAGEEEDAEAAELSSAASSTDDEQRPRAPQIPVRKLSSPLILDYGFTGLLGGPVLRFP